MNSVVKKSVNIAAFIIGGILVFLIGFFGMKHLGHTIFNKQMTSTNSSVALSSASNDAFTPTDTLATPQADPVTPGGCGCPGCCML